MAKFKKEGCQYAQPCWQTKAAEERYNSGELARFGTRSPAPWAKANVREISKTFKQAGNLAKKGKPSNPLSRPSVINASPMPAMRNPGVVGGAPQRYVPPNRRSAAPGGGRGWNRGAPQPAPARAGPFRGSQNPPPRGPPRNPNPSSAPAPRNLAPGGPRYGPPGGAPMHLAPTTSQPPVHASRSPSSNVSGAPHQPSRSSRSNSREPQNTRMHASRAPTMSSPPRASQPPVRSAPTQPSGVVISFNSNHIIHDYIVTKLRLAGVKPPTKISVENGRVQVFFASAADADLASKTQILYDNGVPMQVKLMEKVDESRV